MLPIAKQFPLVGELFIVFKPVVVPRSFVLIIIAWPILYFGVKPILIESIIRIVLFAVSQFFALF